MSNTETKLTREQHDVLIASTENMIAQNAAEIRKWRDKSVAANKVLDKALIDWRAAFPVRSAIDVHKANCEADAARKQALKDQGYPANYVRQSAKPQSDLDAMLLNVRRSAGAKYGSHRRGSFPAHMRGGKLPSDV